MRLRSWRSYGARVRLHSSWRYGGLVRRSRAQRGEGGSRRRAEHPHRARAAGLHVELLDLVENLVAARLPGRHALVVDAEELGLDHGAEEIKVGVRGEEPVRLAAVLRRDRGERRDLLEVIELERG